MTTIRLPYEPSGAEATETPKIAGTYRGRVIIVGGGPTVWDDLKKLAEVKADYMAVNEVGMFMPQALDHWVSIHAEYFQWWLPLRRGASWTPAGLQLNHPTQTHSVQRGAGVRHVWPKMQVPPGHGGSALAACRIAFLLGYESAILAGVPLEGVGHFYEPPDLDRKQHYALTEYSEFLGAFAAAARNEFRGRVTSMSGKTLELLGHP